MTISVDALMILAAIAMLSLLGAILFYLKKLVGLSSGIERNVEDILGTISAAGKFSLRHQQDVKRELRAILAALREAEGRGEMDLSGPVEEQSRAEKIEQLISSGYTAEQAEEHLQAEEYFLKQLGKAVGR